ncbi:MAG: nitroreductase [SAR86 cluster bacterium]|uniref:Putative NAD(P)H nitroreductase n=1 Tax=SAR86 cluster bacterium TaxID=2030880 RepID=A0A2A5B357_9GAMM|nr:MAG: nitroreductase [SAR86 cluster bacterium]
MNALDALHLRSSVPKLSDPLPDQEVLNNIYKAAFRAADHAVLRPWRFLIIKGNSRQRLGQLFVEAARADNPDLSDERIAKLQAKPMRAPMIIVSISSIKEHPKVPAFEQDLSAAAATQNMLQAAFVQNIGAMWRTGSMAYHSVVKNGLGLTAQEKIIGFVYIGTISGGTKQLNEPEVGHFFKDW